jgi:cobalt-zinc-cadmium resistance protein CzcA
VAVLWLFLRSLRGSLIVATVIPLSLLVAFIGLHWLGMPANLISMGAIDFGIMVDGAVVLAENIIRNARQRKPQTANDMRHIIVDSAVAVAHAVRHGHRDCGADSRVLAAEHRRPHLPPAGHDLQLCPAGCAGVCHGAGACAVRPDAQAQACDGGRAQDLRPCASWLPALDRQVLGAAKRRTAVIAVFVSVLVVAGVSAKWLGTEFLPELDEGDAYVLVQMPASISLEKGQEVLRDVRLRLKVFPEVITVTTEQGRPESGTDNETLNLAKVLVRLKPHGDWRKGLTKPALIEEMRATLGEIPGVAFNCAAHSRQRGRVHIGRARPGGTQAVRPRYSHPARHSSADQVAGEGIDGVVDLDLYRDAPAPQVHVQFDRQALARQGIAMEDAQKTLEVALAGNVATTLWEGEFPCRCACVCPMWTAWTKSAFATSPYRCPMVVRSPWDRSVRSA